MTGHANGGQASDQANQVGQAGAGNHSGQVKSKARRNGQIRSESHRGHRHQTWQRPTQEHRNDTHRSVVSLPACLSVDNAGMNMYGWRTDAHEWHQPTGVRGQDLVAYQTDGEGV